MSRISGLPNTAFVDQVTPTIAVSGTQFLSADVADVSGPGPDDRFVNRRCRIMLVGNGAAGKTTLAYRLVKGRPPYPYPGITHGMLQRTDFCVCVKVEP